MPLLVLFRSIEKSNVNFFYYLFQFYINIYFILSIFSFLLFSTVSTVLAVGSVCLIHIQSFSKIDTSKESQWKMKTNRSNIIRICVKWSVLYIIFYKKRQTFCCFVNIKMEWQSGNRKKMREQIKEKRNFWGELSARIFFKKKRRTNNKTTVSTEIHIQKSKCKYASINQSTTSSIYIEFVIKIT